MTTDIPNKSLYGAPRCDFSDSDEPSIDDTCVRYYNTLFRQQQRAGDAAGTYAKNPPSLSPQASLEECGLDALSRTETSPRLTTPAGPLSERVTRQKTSFGDKVGVGGNLSKAGDTDKVPVVLGIERDWLRRRVSEMSDYYAEQISRRDQQIEQQFEEERVLQRHLIVHSPTSGDCTLESLRHSNDKLEALMGKLEEAIELAGYGFDDSERQNLTALRTELADYKKRADRLAAKYTTEEQELEAALQEQLGRFHRERIETDRVTNELLTNLESLSNENERLKGRLCALKHANLT